MPNPVSAGQVRSYSFGPLWVRNNRPECIAAIGLVALAWTHLENTLGSMISGILGRTSRGDGGGWGINPNWITAALMNEAESIRTRIKFVDAVLMPLLASHHLASDWELLKKRLYKRARERNVIVHSVWAIAEEFPAKVLRVDKAMKLEAWDEADFLSVYDRIDALTTEINAFMGKVLLEIHEKRITYNITPDMIMSPASP